MISTRPAASDRMEPPRIAIVGAGVAGAACAAALLRAGFDVTVFEKSGGVGGRMATRRTRWTDVDGTSRSVEFDHGCPHFTATRPRFQAVIRRAEAHGCVARWHQRVYATFRAPQLRDVVVPTPGMPALSRHLLSGVPLRLGHAVSGLQRSADGWLVHLADGSVDGGGEGPFDHVLLAIPAAQAATLLRRHQTGWADALASVRMAPCWTLMAVTDDLDWPWDAAQIERGPLAWVARNDRAPGRCPPSGLVPWVAHASPAWSLAHLDDDPAQVAKVLRAAFGDLLAGARPARFHYTGVHRWRYAQLAQAASAGIDCWWSEGLGLGVCGDSFGNGSVEAAWCSGDELADAVAASFHAAPVTCASTTA
ncbi:MAG: FAD-dependent oxidoreductase [Variovorax sp.]